MLESGNYGRRVQGRTIAIAGAPGKRVLANNWGGTPRGVRIHGSVKPMQRLRPGEKEVRNQAFNMCWCESGGEGGEKEKPSENASSGEGVQKGEKNKVLAKDYFGMQDLIIRGKTLPPAHKGRRGGSSAAARTTSAEQEQNKGVNKQESEG